MKTLVGKIANVTGASAPRDIGRAIAIRLAQEGAVVLLTDIDGVLHVDGIKHNNIAFLAKSVTDIEAQGGKAIALEVDVTKQSNISNCVETAKEKFGKIDTLVNNAGALSGSSGFLDTTPMECETSFQVNLLGPMMFSQAVVTEMQQTGGGSIVNIGSTGSLGAEAGFGAYTTMKHGLIGLTKTIAAEFGVDGISVTPYALVMS